MQIAETAEDKMIKRLRQWIDAEDKLIADPAGPVVEDPVTMRQVREKFGIGAKEVTVAALFYADGKGLTPKQREIVIYLLDLLNLKDPEIEDCETARSKLRPLNSLTSNIVPLPGALPPECQLTGEFTPRAWDCTTFTWKASNLCHQPLYFEQPRLERYGHTLPPVIQPIFSAAHFFVSVPLLPYNMGIELPNECVYSLGYYRPGSCAPYQIPGFPLSVRGAFYEAGLVGALFFVH